MHKLVAVWLAIIIIGAAVSGPFAASPVSGTGQRDTSRPSSSERLIVRFQDPSWSAAVQRLSPTEPVSVSSTLMSLNSVVATYPSEQAAASALDQLSGDPAVEWAEPDGRAYHTYEPQDPLFEDQIWAESIDLPAAWNLTSGQQETVVAVVDSGVSSSHPDLAGKVLPGRDFLNGDDTVEDDVGHGTAVAGIIAARAGDDIGIAGVAMNTRILPIKVGSVEGAPVSALANGIVWAVEQQADVINLSLVADQSSQALEEAVQYAYDQNIPVITAAGNGPETVSYPGAYEQTISVGASTFWGGLAGFSSRENRVDLIAPGTGVLTSWWSEENGNDWTTVTGTSFATPMVSGVVALLRSLDHELTVEEIRALLRENALPVEGDSPVAGSGAGLLDAGATVRALLSGAFERVWRPVDSPVSMGLADRTWIWGPSSIASGFEPYAQAQHGQRLVRYYDKGRMEINNPGGDYDDSWYVTSGLLVQELVTGRVQVGDASYMIKRPAEIVIAGDPLDALAPTYADLEDLLDSPPAGPGELLTRSIDSSGIVVDDPGMADHGVTASWYVPETNHQIASVFWEYLNRQGLVLQDGELTDRSLFTPQFFVTGLPITEAYWTRVLVDGERRDVLVQCFERRCLTYTPSNPPEWQVEMANVGRHYYRWRYPVETEYHRPEPPTARQAW